MELRLLRSFLVVATELNFTRASRKLHLAQSSVSAQIKMLEEDLGIKLFDRIGRTVVLTDAGEKLKHYAKRIEEMSQEMRSDLTSSRVLQGAITIRMPETLASEYMPRVVDRFHTENPGVRINFINCDDARLREELNSGSIDLAFLLTDHILGENLTITDLGTEPLVLVAAPHHPLVPLPEITSNDMQNQSILFMRVD